MIFGQSRRELRTMFADAWQRHQARAPLSPLHAQIVEVIAAHPEYQAAIAGRDVDREYSPDEGETNPYLHMGLHLGIRDQVATDRPRGIRRLFEALAARRGDRHAAEHAMIDCLAATLWEAQSDNRAPDERVYLERLRKL